MVRTMRGVPVGASEFGGITILGREDELADAAREPHGEDVEAFIFIDPAREVKVEREDAGGAKPADVEVGILVLDAVKHFAEGIHGLVGARPTTWLA